MIRKHAKVIDAFDAILVVNCQKDSEDNYIGGNTLIEMGYAHIMYKKNFLLNDIPDLPLFRACLESILMTPFCAILAAKPSDLLNVVIAMLRRSSGFSLKISSKWLWKKDSKQALRQEIIAMEPLIIHSNFNLIR